MKEVNVLVVGLGLAGLAYVETLRENQKSFHVIDQSGAGSSVIAAGIYNPTVLKRFNMTWNGEEFHQTALPFYTKIAQRLKVSIDYPAPIYKLFNDSSEHNQWMVAADRSGLSNFLLPTINKDTIEGVKALFGYGELQSCGRINTTRLIEAYKTTIETNITEACFDFSALEILPEGIRYKNIKAKHIVFCEGYAMVNNPFFNHLPLVGSKGQILIIRSPKLNSTAILKGPIFIAPLGDDLYWAGASFEQHDKSLETTAKGKQWICDKIAKMIDVPYTIEKHISHIRPTVKDRRPLLGAHPKHKQLYLFNGLGSRGVLTAPLASNWLYAYIEEGKSLPAAVDIDRFQKIN